MENNVVSIGHNTPLGKAAADARAALVDVAKAGEAEIEAWLAYGAALNYGRGAFDSDEEFGQWKVLEKLDIFVTDKLSDTRKVNDHDAAAAMWAAANPEELVLAQGMPGNARSLRGWHAVWKRKQRATILSHAVDYHLKDRQKVAFDVIHDAGPEGITREALIAGSAKWPRGEDGKEWATRKHVDTNIAPLFLKEFICQRGGRIIAAGHPDGPDDWPEAPFAPKPKPKTAAVKPKTAAVKPKPKVTPPGGKGDPAGKPKASTAVPASTPTQKPASGPHKGAAVVPGKVIPAAKKAPPIQAVPKGKGLTREQVDPEFVGSDAEFINEYGHVWIQTAEERATTRFNAWAAMMRYLAKEWNRPDITPQKVDLNWLRSPKPADVDKMRDAVTALRPVLAAAEAALARAEEALAAKAAGKPVGKLA